MVAGGSVLAPLVIRGRGAVPVLEAHPLDVTLDIGPTERPARVTVVAIDAGSLDFITSATAEGRLPNFGRILDAGAVMHLATLHPTSADADWAAVSTGKQPQKNGVRSAGIYRLAEAGDPIQLLPDYRFATAWCACCRRAAHVGHVAHANVVEHSGTPASLWASWDGC
jgi:hypothetical protein